MSVQETVARGAVALAQEVIRLTAERDALRAERDEQCRLKHACIGELERLREAVAALTAEQAICKLNTGMAIHALTCVHHSDAERAALRPLGNCPICADRQIAALTAERDALKAELDTLGKEKP